MLRVFKKPKRRRKRKICVAIPSPSPLMWMDCALTTMRTVYFREIQRTSSQVANKSGAHSPQQKTSSPPVLRLVQPGGWHGWFFYFTSKKHAMHCPLCALCTVHFRRCRTFLVFRTRPPGAHPPTPDPGRDPGGRSLYEV